MKMKEKSQAAGGGGGADKEGGHSQRGSCWYLRVEAGRKGEAVKRFRLLEMSGKNGLFKDASKRFKQN